MVKRISRVIYVLVASVLLFSCGDGGDGLDDLQLDVKVSLDGKPATQAVIIVDGVEEGTTDDEGSFSKVIRKKVGTEVKVSVSKSEAGYRTKPWAETFFMKAPGEAMDKYSFEVALKSTKFITFAVTEKGAPLEGAAIKIGKKKVGTTDSGGNFTYDYKKAPKKGFRLLVSKKGYTRWKKTVKVTPGQELEVSLSQQITVTVRTATDEYGLTKRIPGITVHINGKEVGKTNKNGYLRYVYSGKPGKEVELKLSSSRHIPKVWKDRLVLKGSPEIERFFYSSKPKKIRVGIYGYVSNTPDDTLEAVRSRIGEALGNRLFSYMSLREVPNEELIERMKKSKVSIERATTKGWQKTRLTQSVDMIILGSVLKDENGLTFETKVYTSNGKLLLSQISTIRKEKQIKKVAKKIAKSIMEQFPFEGIIIAKEDDRFKVNLGKTDYRIKRGMEFDLLAAKLSSSGKVEEYKDIGTLKVKSPEGEASWTEALNLQDYDKVEIGNKVVRRLITEEEEQATKNSFVLVANGGVPPDVSPLPSVNIYLNGMWVGSTNSKGKAEIPVRLGKGQELVLYRHGYQQLSEEIWVQNDKEVKQFTLEVNSSLFKVDSEPSKAKVFIDNNEIGSTPILKGTHVNFGFHKLRLSVGGDYRPWEKIVEFNKNVVDLTGKNKVLLFKDYMKIGKRAEASGNIDAAINAYTNTERNHPDYSNAHHRLAQLYMDEKQDYDAAIREFDNVLSLPENKQLVFKQFAVAYTNIGHAYYEKGNRIIKKDRKGAAQNFGKAIQNLEKAMQNTRFFPTQHYDEAVHDTYYYLAISYHKLYLATRKSVLLDKADHAWSQYFDFYPKKLESDENFVQFKEAAQKYWTQVKDLI